MRHTATASDIYLLVWYTQRGNYCSFITTTAASESHVASFIYIKGRLEAQKVEYLSSLTLHLIRAPYTIPALRPREERKMQLLSVE